MPPRMRDAPKLEAMGDLLHQIEGTLRQFSEVAGKSGHEGGHEQLDQINKSLGAISDSLKGLNTTRDHSAAYAQIEQSLTDMVSQVKSIAKGASPR